MRRRVAAIVLTAVFALVPAGAAQAETPEPVRTQMLWPLCVTLAGWTACIPP